MARVRIYTTTTCPYCVRAKALLAARGIAYDEVDVSRDAAMRAELVELSGGRRTVPQVFIDGQPIGGSDELHALDRAGGLRGLTP